MEDKQQSKMGRPKTPEYRKKRFRFSAIEDAFNDVLENMENERDRKLVLQTLEKLKA